MPQGGPWTGERRDDPEFREHHRRWKIEWREVPAPPVNSDPFSGFMSRLTMTTGAHNAHGSHDPQTGSSVEEIALLGLIS
jgi:hypothetical protein